VCAKHQTSLGLINKWEQAAERGALSALYTQPRGCKRLRRSGEALLTEPQRLREVMTELSAENVHRKMRHWP
jgi:hypothetical protein